MTKSDHMKFWDSVCKTDPEILKYVDQKGGFHAIDAQSQLKAATAQWGPYGGTWGVKECNYGIILDGDCTPIEATIEGLFFCPIATFEIASDCAFRAGNDTRKKLLTDITTKALSKLGFNSDVFEGAFDGDKNVGKKAPPKAKAEPPKAKAKPPADDNAAFLDACSKKVKEGIEFFMSIGNDADDAQSCMNERVEDILKGMTVACGTSYVSAYEIKGRDDKECYYRSLSATVDDLAKEME